MSKHKLTFCILAMVVPLVPTSSTAGGQVLSPTTRAPSSPPVQICGNADILNGPQTPPPGAVRVAPNQNLYDLTQANAPGTTFWLAPGTHTLGTSPYNQVVPKDGNTYIGAPGAVLDGQGINYYAFTQKATGVTVKHLTIQGFMAPGDEGVVNHDYGARWVIERNTIQRNGGAGVIVGDDNRLSYNCLADNGQYGFQGFGANMTIDHNEVARNNTYDYEAKMPGCGCSGGAKFWDSGPARVTDNWVHDNAGVGLWADTNNVGFLFEGNWISDNRAQAILYETSYNFRIVNNTIRRNGFHYGKEFEARGDPFPFPAVYISESGGDTRVAGGLYAASEISGNVFEDNWGGVVLWENADRFGHDESANTSKGYTTLAVDPTGTWRSPRMADCGPGVIDPEPNFSNCRWKTQNVSVTNNDFRVDKAAIGCTSNCATHGLFSNWGTIPAWSPYKARVVQDAITFRQNNRFSNNRYLGDWRFAAYEAVGNPLRFDQWQAAPYNQDGGSSPDP